MSYFINDVFVSEEDAKISVLDLGLLRGFSLFEYLRTYGKRPFHLHDHLERLRYSASQVGLPLPYTFDEFSQIIDKLLESFTTECSIKILLTGGLSEDQFTPTAKPSCIIFAYPHTNTPATLYDTGIATISTTLQRSLPDCKTTQYLPAILARQSAPKAHEALYIAPDGEILEATTSNFFAIKQGSLYTSTSPNLLHGITREIVLQLAQRHDIPVSTDKIYLSDIPTYDEAFITSTNKEILPVTCLDFNPIGQGEVGPKTRYLASLFQAYIKKK